MVQGYEFLSVYVTDRLDQHGDTEGVCKEVRVFGSDWKLAGSNPGVGRYILHHHGALTHMCS